MIKKLTKYSINIVNDISALQDIELISVIKENNLSVSLMHMQGVPKICKIILLMMMSLVMYIVI